MHTLFRDKNSGDFYISSKFSLEYPDYMTMVDTKHLEVVHEGTKKECLKKEEEFLETA